MEFPQDLQKQGMLPELIHRCFFLRQTTRSIAKAFAKIECCISVSFRYSCKLLVRSGMKQPVVTRPRKCEPFGFVMKRCKPGASLVRILGKKGGGTSVAGAGILISDCHVMTCDHVVEGLADEDGRIFLDFPLLDARRELTATIELRIHEKKEPDPSRPEDVCILKLERNQTLPVNACPARFLNPEDEHAFGLEVTACGFPENMEEGDLGDWVEGNIRGGTGRGFVQIDHSETSRDIVEGFSGSPVFDKERRFVAGMLVSINVRQDKRSGYMIPVSLLQKAWPDLCVQQEPKSEDTEEESVAVKESDDGPVVAKMCDRGKEDEAFENFFCAKCTECSNQPQFYIVCGKKGDCHASLIDRFVATHVREYIESHWFTTVTPPKPIHVIWPSHGSPDLRKKHLRKNIVRAFAENLSGQELSIADLCERLKLEEHRVVVLYHDILTSRIDQGFEELARFYATECWGAFECREDFPLFLVFFNLISSSPDNRSFLEKMKDRFFGKKPVERVLKDSFGEMETVCIIGELTDPDEDDVYEWFRNYKAEISEDQCLKLIKDIFGGQKALCMSAIEAALEQLQ